MRRYILIAVLSVVTLSAETITVSMSRSPDSANFNGLVTNNSGYSLGQMTFELSGTKAFTGEQLVITNVLYFVVPNGIATFGQDNRLGSGFSTFSFVFANLYSGNTFMFGWDPGTVSNADYLPSIAEAAGTRFTALTNAGGTISGVLQVQDDTVTATVPSQVPEPNVVWLFGDGLLGFVGLCWIRQRLSGRRIPPVTGLRPLLDSQGGQRIYRGSSPGWDKTRD